MCFFNHDIRKRKNSKGAKTPPFPGPRHLISSQLKDKMVEVFVPVLNSE
jgi:hypothetical protein